MPAFVVHGLIGYLVYGKMGFYLGILPDIIGFSYYFLRVFVDYLSGREELVKELLDQKSPDAGLQYMNNLDWIIYNISHSVFFWGLIYFIFKKKYILSAILSIILDIFLHSNEGWPGPTFLYPFSNYRFDGISWNSRKGMFITLFVILFYLSRK